uniref:RPM1-interacting protein 4 n=1 Tax=Anthurium amnicola TaxID=1678845 RepID=A0A1D1YE61_9ARAE
MAQQPHVPKFGNWESDGNVPYTQYFDNARKGKGVGKMVNPNDPQLSKDVAAVRASPVRTAPDMEIAKPKHEQRTSREDGNGDLRRLPDSPARYEVIGRKPGADVSHQRHGERLNSNDPKKRSNQMSIGSDRSIENSPVHPHYQVKSASKVGVSSPSWERKGSPEGGHAFAPSTPGMSKLRPANRDDEIADKGSTVPKFGDWDESNPSSADGYTHIFNKVREEKQVGSAKVPIIKTDPMYSDGHRQNSGNHKSSSCSWFGWCRK